MIKVQPFTFNPFEENTYVISDESGECVIIDPGCYEPAEERELADYIEEHHLKPVACWLTHAHIDHVLGCAFVHEKWNLKPQVHRDDLKLLQSVKSYGELWGFKVPDVPTPEKFIGEDDAMNFGQSEMKVIFSPGHSPGHVVFYSANDRLLIGGDVLFNGSIGRTDLPGGNHEELIRNIRTKLLTLPGETVVYCGHGPETTIEAEKKFNPFLND